MTKKLHFLFLVLFTMPINAQWNAQNSGVAANLKDLYCITENAVVVVGEGGTILKTIDGGEHWVQKTSGTVQDLLKLQFVNSMIGYAVGSSGTLLKTIDGGENWTAINIGITTNLFGLTLLNENTFYISGENGLVKMTIDGGNSFTSKNITSDQSVKSIQFLNDLVGYAQDDYVLKKTTDGGTTWTTVETNDSTSSFYFLNENIGFIHLSGGIYKTTDGGLSLSPFAEAYAYQSSLFSLNENTVWTAENTWFLCNCENHCIKKMEVTNMGENNSIENCRIGEVAWGIPFERVYFANETKGYAVGWYGAIYKNTTGTMLNTNEIDKKNAVRIYPNPASNHITVSFTQNSTQPFSVAITDFLGKNIYSKSYATENSVTINTENFSRGIYFLTLISQDKKQTQKLIIN